MSADLRLCSVSEQVSEPVSVFNLSVDWGGCFKRVTRTKFYHKTYRWSSSLFICCKSDCRFCSCTICGLKLRVRDPLRAGPAVLVLVQWSVCSFLWPCMPQSEKIKQCLVVWWSEWLRNMVCCFGPFPLPADLSPALPHTHTHTVILLSLSFNSFFPLWPSWFIPLYSH